MSGIDTSGAGLVIPEYPQDINYTSFESVSDISENGIVAEFLYNSDNERARMEVKQGGNTILVRWYPSGGYIKETSGGVTREYTFIGGDAYSAPVVAITQNGSTTYYYLLRDYLGSITHVVDSTNNSVVAEYSYDVWGRMRDPTTWENYSPGSEPAPIIAGRGFTSHEHLPWFSFINMNGRVYEPLTGQFLSPDNYVQSHDFTQSFNRYGYCVNNPLKYTDPTGEFFGTIFTAIGGFIYSVGSTVYNYGKAVLTEGAIDPWNTQSNRNQAWDEARGSTNHTWDEYGRKTDLAWQIDKGLIKTDENRTIVGRGLQLISRFTWEATQTWLGNFISHGRNIGGEVDDVSYYGGATLVNKNDNSGTWWGFSLGPYINSLNLVADPSISPSFRHEFGHTLQSRLVGPLYLTYVGLPSLIGQGLDDLGINDHDREWYETQANSMAERYFRNQDPGALNALPWNFNQFPTNYNPNWYWLIAHPPLPFMWWLLF